MGGETVALHHSHYCDGLLLQIHWMLHQEPLFWKAAYRNLNEKTIIHAHNVLHCLSILCFMHTMYCTVCLSYASCTQCTALSVYLMLHAHNVLHCPSILCFMHTMYYTICLSYASCTQRTALSVYLMLHAHNILHCLSILFSCSQYSAPVCLSCALA